MSPLESHLRARIRSQGPLPFVTWMAAALYHPEHGYYSGPARVGRRGDFITSVSVGALFGSLLAGQFCEAWEALDRPGVFHLIERGGNDGSLARDILTWAHAHRPDFYRAIIYQMEEPLEVLQHIQTKALAVFPGKLQHGPARAADGIFFANELLDAIPFRRVTWTGSEWLECCVQLDGEDFCWTTRPLIDSASLRRLASLGTRFPPGYTTEVSPAAASEIRLAASSLERGLLCFIDYGYPAADYYDPARVTGTLRCYRQHTSHENPLKDPGQSDITAHVDFSHAAAVLAASGCRPTAFMDQAQFLTGAAASALKSMEGQRPGPDTLAWLRQFQTLTHPSLMGSAFRVLLATKNCPTPLLTGLRHASPTALLSILPDMGLTQRR